MTGVSIDEARAQMRSLDRSLPLALLRARESVMRRFRPLLAEHGLTEQQWRVLRVLIDADNSLSVGEVAERACILGPSLSRMLVALDERDLIRRGNDAVDGRRAEIELTPHGIDLVGLIAPSSEAVYRQLEADLGADELHHLERTLHTLTALT